LETSQSNTDRIILEPPLSGRGADCNQIPTSTHNHTLTTGSQVLTHNKNTTVTGGMLPLSSKAEGKIKSIRVVALMKN
jgi:hypothetical protein